MDIGLLFVNIGLIIMLLASLGLTIIGMPGNIVIFLTALAYGFYDHFVHLSLMDLGIVLGAIILGEVFETFTGALWASREKASKRAIIFAVFGTVFGGIIGTAFTPVIGSIIGALVGGFAVSWFVEYQLTNDKQHAIRVAMSVIKGQMLGVIIKFTIALVTIIYLLFNLAW